MRPIRVRRASPNCVTLRNRANIACVFAEPQFDPKLVETVFDGVARHGVVDPLAIGVDPGPDLYPVLMRDMASALADCLGGKS